VARFLVQGQVQLFGFCSAWELFGVSRCARDDGSAGQKTMCCGRVGKKRDAKKTTEGAERVGYFNG